MIIIVEGNIGAGKSSFAKSLSNFLKLEGFNVVHIVEPVDSWINFNGNNLLNLMYSNKDRWAFTFQTNALIDTRINECKALECSESGSVVVMERSSFSVVEIFSELYKNTILHAIESDILEKLNHTVPSGINSYKNKIIVYLRTEPSVCLERITNRARLEEVNKIEITYIDQLHKIHEQKVTPDRTRCQILSVDGSSFEENNIKGATLVYDKNTFFFDVLMDSLKHLPVEKL